MAYQRLPYAQYFIDTSENFHGSGTVRRVIRYQAVAYTCNPLERLLGIRHEVNYEICYEPDRDVIQLNFQKTNGKSDWFANIAEFSSGYDRTVVFRGKPLPLRVHHGWGRMYEAIKAPVRQTWLGLHRLHPTAATEIIGWSLGSGQAMLCAQDLHCTFGVKPYLYTFGSVRPFKHTLFHKAQLHAYLSGICTQCRNFADRNDLVTYMPPFRGFTMPERWVVGRKGLCLTRLLHPGFYHTHYDDPELYVEIP